MVATYREFDWHNKVWVANWSLSKRQVVAERVLGDLFLLMKMVKMNVVNKRDGELDIARLGGVAGVVNLITESVSVTGKTKVWGFTLDFFPDTKRFQYLLNGQAGGTVYQHSNFRAQFNHLGLFVVDVVNRERLFFKKKC